MTRRRLFADAAAEDRAQRLRGPALLADHLAEILLGDLELEHQRVRLGDLLDLDLLGPVDETARQKVDQLARALGSPGF